MRFRRAGVGFAAIVLIGILVGGCGEMRKPDQEIEFSLDLDDKPLFVEIIKGFAADMVFSVEDIGDEVPTTGPGSVFFILNRDDEVRIYIANVNKPDKFHIGIFDRSGSSDWEPFWLELMTRLNKTWPDTFPDPAKSG